MGPRIGLLWALVACTGSSGAVCGRTSDCPSGTVCNTAGQCEGRARTVDAGAIDGNAVDASRIPPGLDAGTDDAPVDAP
jgi:hypothetical protein